MGLDAALDVVPDRTDGQFAFEGSESGFHFSKLDVLTPEGVGIRRIEIGAQEIGALTQLGSSQARLIPRPQQLAAAVFNRAEHGPALGITLFETAKPTLDFARVLESSARHNTTQSAQIFWQVTAPAPQGGRIRKTFRDREDARIYHERAKVQLMKFGTAAMIDDRTRTDAARAMELLAGTGKTLLDAARFLVEHIRRTEGGKPLGGAVADFLETKRAEHLSDRYLDGLRHRLTRLEGGRMLKKKVRRSRRKVVPVPGER